MSAVKDAITAIREAMKLAEDVKRVGDSLKAVSQELRDHDRRITRLEARLDTIMDIASIQGGRQRLGDNG